MVEKIVASILVSLATATFWAVLKLFRSLADIRSGVLVILRFSLMDIVSHDSISYEDLERANEVYRIYKHLGGNGTGSMAVNDIRERYIENARKSNEPVEG